MSALVSTIFLTKAVTYSVIEYRRSMAARAERQRKAEAADREQAAIEAAHNAQVWANAAAALRERDAASAANLRRIMLPPKAVAPVKPVSSFDPTNVASWMGGADVERIEVIDYLEEQLHEKRRTGGDAIVIGLTDTKIIIDRLNRPTAD